MSKLLSTLTACGLITLACVGFAVAADQSQPNPPQSAPGASMMPRPGEDVSKKEQEYLSALKKCEGLAEQERRKCVQAVKDRYGVM